MYVQTRDLILQFALCSAIFHVDLSKPNEFETFFAFFFFLQGMKYLGEMKLLHRDLAARNILVCNRNHVKISDFGLAQFLDDTDYYYIKTPREVPIKW